MENKLNTLLQETDCLLNLIGNTPMIRVKHNFDNDCMVSVKMESYNPGGSIKDRAVFKIITTAEIQGKLKFGDTIIEATSGNTGVAAALIGAIKGYKVKIVTHNKISQEKAAIIKRYGAELIFTDSALPHTDSQHYVQIAKDLALNNNYFYIDQFNNALNSQTHFESTGPEIWRQTNGGVDLFVCGIGSGGTISGVAQYLKSKNPKIHVVAADPVGSIYYSEFKNKIFSNDSSWAIEGIGSNFIPSVLDFNVVDDVIPVFDSIAINYSRFASENFGLDLGMSSGAILHVAMEHAKSGGYKNIVAIAPDSSQRYLSKM